MALVGIGLVFVVAVVGIGAIYSAGHHAVSKPAATTLSIDNK